MGSVLQEMEHGLLVLEFVSFVVAFSRRETGIWFGLASFGGLTEWIGFAVVETHQHAQFVLQVADFLPLKEMLWYPLCMHSCWMLVEGLGVGEEPMRAGLAMSVLNQFSNMPYDFIGAMNQFGFWKFNLDFPFMNLGVGSLDGISGVFFSWLVIGFCCGFMISWCHINRVNPMLEVVILTIGPNILSPILWSYFHMIKAIGCFVDNMEMDHVTCIRTCPISDKMIWMSAFLISWSLFMSNLKAYKALTEYAPLAILGGYQLCIFLIVFKYGNDPDLVRNMGLYNVFTLICLYFICYHNPSRAKEKQF